MASNVFGTPITDETLESMPEFYNKVITREDRATVALNMKNSESKDVNARNFVENLRAEWGSGVCVMGLIYNATGDPITFILGHDYHGHIGSSPYPQELANGQWGGFLHVKPSVVPDGSMAAIVYRGKNASGDECDWMLGWSNPWSRLWSHNHAYTEIRQARHYQDEDNWNYIGDLITNSELNYSGTWNGCLANASIGNVDASVYEAVATLENA